VLFGKQRSKRSAMAQSPMLGPMRACAVILGEAYELARRVILEDWLIQQEMEAAKHPRFEVPAIQVLGRRLIDVGCPPFPCPRDTADFCTTHRSWMMITCASDRRRSGQPCRL
jgi:hypothetical protein